MRFGVRISILISLVLVTFSVFVYILNHPSSKGEEENIPEKIMEAEEEDKPEEDEVQKISVLVCGTDETDTLTDVIFLAMYDVESQKINLLQIPRDSYIGEEYPSGKINSVYGLHKDHQDGIKALEDIIEYQFLVPVDYTAVISLNAFRNIIDGLGGVRMVVDRQINYTPGKVLYEGEQLLTGEQCEWIVRYRKGYLTGDIGRMEQQRNFLSALIDTVREKGRIKAVSLLVKNYTDIRTDMPKTKAISYANKVFNEVKNEDINVFTLEGDGLYSGSYAVYQLRAEQAAEVLNEHFRPYSEDVGAEELNLAKVPNPTYPEYNNSAKDNEPIVEQPKEAEEIPTEDEIYYDDSELDMQEQLLEDILEKYDKKREEMFEE